jgi:hypothetical protein
MKGNHAENAMDPRGNAPVIKNISIEHPERPGVFLNFDDQGLYNIVIKKDPYILMSVKQWTHLVNSGKTASKRLTEEQALEEFGVKID